MNVKLSASRDLPLLQWLWKWKIATTAGIKEVFFPKNSMMTAYKRLWKLKKAKYIRMLADSEGQNFVWGLDQKGFAAVSNRLPALEKAGFKSENIGHDLIVMAAHLGEYHQVLPTGVELFSEQELRCFHIENYPEWIPKSVDHRPDGYWRLPYGNGAITIALEIELNQKRNSFYEQVAAFYLKHQIVYRVVWIVDSEPLGKTIANLMASTDKESSVIHCFIRLEDFKTHGWDTQFFLGIERDRTLSQLVNASKKIGAKQIENSSKNISRSFLLDGRKAPLKSTACSEVVAT